MLEVTVEAGHAAERGTELDKHRHKVASYVVEGTAYKALDIAGMAARTAA
jgi:hypothetical protein